MQFVTGYPDGWRPTHFQQVAIVDVTRAYLRERGMLFSSGEDELGQFDECVVSVDGTPFILQHYVKPLRRGFAVEVPRRLFGDISEVSRKLSALLVRLGIKSDDLIWRHADVELQLPVPDKTEPPSVADPNVEYVTRAAAVRTAQRVRDLYAQGNPDHPRWASVFSSPEPAYKSVRPLAVYDLRALCDPRIGGYRLEDHDWVDHLRSADVSACLALHELTRALEALYQHGAAAGLHDDDEAQVGSDKPLAPAAKRGRTSRRAAKVSKRTA
jgi:hypothetical protein